MQSNIFGDFAGEGGSDSLLDNFDFDTFINNPDEGATNGLFTDFTFAGALETGTGES